MAEKYELRCDCGSIGIALTGAPHVRAYCHCRNCRDLLNVAVNVFAAWKEAAFEVLRGQDRLAAYQYPGTLTVRYWCRECGAGVYSTNTAGDRLVPQALFRKHTDGRPPQGLLPTQHLFYRERVADFIDDLPKYLGGPDGPLYTGSTQRIF
jgi:hypothetical protein